MPKAILSPFVFFTYFSIYFTLYTPSNLLIDDVVGVSSMTANAESL